jgi:DNA-binding XRE family transcriptional regulator
MNKVNEKSNLPLLTGGKFRFIREQAGLARHQFAGFAGISVSTIRIIEVWKKNEIIKIAYVKKLKEMVGEEVFTLALKLYKKFENEGTLGYYYRID